MIVIAVLAILVIAITTALATRLRIASPLILVAIGIVVSFLPFVPPVLVDPEWILVGVLPPLLYSAAVRLPALEFRRDLRAIGGLSVLLVIVSALVIGVFFWLAVPSVGFPLGVAVGAILSPTDAVATSIAKRLGISARVTTILEGESLLNDATALVLLRTAIVAIAGSFSFWGSAGTFALSVVVALVVGGIVGWVSLHVRAVIRNSAAVTAVSFTVPFIAYIPSEHLGGSGLVAAVAAGIVSAQGADRLLTPEARMAHHLNWRTIELVLEGAVFLLMGLEIRHIIADNASRGRSFFDGAWLALAALAIVLLVRAGYVSALVAIGAWRSRRGARRREALSSVGARLQTLESGRDDAPDSPLGRTRLSSVRARLQRALADIDYYEANPLGWRQGTVIVWAGMRGVVTLAAAQTLPRDIADRPLLILVAFLVALSSLVLQGFTLPVVVRKLGLAGEGDRAAGRDERRRLEAELRVAAASVLDGDDLHRADGTPFDPVLLEAARQRAAAQTSGPDPDRARDFRELRLKMLRAERERLAELSSGGAYSTAALREVRADIDADELSLQRRQELA